MAGEDPMRTTAAPIDTRLTYDDFLLFPTTGSGTSSSTECTT
jgi:hypothetical protein